jgi:hypothetical protein
MKESTVHGCWKRLCPDLMQDFVGFEETFEEKTKEVVYLMNELNVGVSIEGVDELIASYSEIMSNENLMDIQEENERPHKAEGDDCQSPPTTTLKEVKEVK